MKLFKLFLISLLSMVAGGMQSVYAQTAVTVGAQVTSEGDIVSGQAYVLQSQSAGTGTIPYINDNGADYDIPMNNACTQASVYYLISNGDGTWKIKNYYTNHFWGVPVYNQALASVADDASAGVWSLNFSDGIAYPSAPDADGTTRGLDRSEEKLLGYSTGTTSTKQVKIYEIGYGLSEVYTLNNTNTDRGALTYEPAKSTRYVWSSGKSGATAFDATNVNHQWVLVYTGTPSQYYLYNVGAGKFAIPTNIAQGPANAWVFSDNAVAVIFETQGDGTKKIKMATNPVNGTNAAYMAVSNNYTGPIINYNDIGGNFTITKVDDADASTAANAAIAKLIKSQTALTSYPQASGWYAIQVKSKKDAASYSGRYLQTAASLYDDLYPLTFTGGVDVQPAITDPSFFTYINHTSWDVNTWQLPDGRYLVKNSNSKFPTPSATAGNVLCGYSNGNYFKTDDNWYADPYNSNANYFIGETTSMRTAYTVYPIDLSSAGLVAWQVLCDNASESTKITCSRSDVSGLTSVYKNGYFFLPAGVTPEAGDFTLDGANGVTIDATAKTITFAYDPNLAIVADGVSVAQGYQTTGRGNANAILLRVTLSPLRDATDVKLNVTLKDDALTAASRIAVYELASATPEFYAQTLGDPVASVDNPSSSDIQLNIGTFTQSTPRYLWLTADVKNDALLGSIIDAAVASITYTCNEKETTFELTSGDPVDRGAMVLDVQQYLFLPTTDDAKCYRIPAMIVADDGSILAAVDKRYANHNDIGNGRVIDIVLRRSTDGGKTWSDVKTIAKGQGSSNLDYCAYGDPTLVKCTDGTIISTACVGNLGFTAGLNRFSVMKSTDNGVTWTDPVDVTSVSGMLTNKAGLTDFFVTSGKGLCTSDGVIMYLALSSSYKSYVVYSVDKGEHWVIDDQVVISSSANEAKLEQMNDGTLIASSRNASAGNRLFNKGSYVNNGDGTLTFTWGTQYGVSALSQSGANNQDILYYSRANEIGSETVGASTGNPDILLHTMTSGNHANLKLFMSINQANTWTEVMQIQPNGARYSTMQRLSNGDLAILFEDGALGQNEPNNATITGYQYPINYITITKAQIEALYAEMTEINTTFHIMDVAGATLLEKEETVMGVQTEIPTSLKRAFCTYTMYSDAAMTQQISKIGSNTDVYVKCEYSGPVEFSTVENPKWYFLYSHKQNDIKDYVAYTENNEFKMAAASFFDFYSNKAYQWAFIGNPYDVRVLNRGNNGYLASSAMKAASNNQSLKAYVTTDVSAYPYYSFSLYGFSNSQVTVDNPFSLFLDPAQGTFLNGSNGNLYYHTSVVPSSELKLTNWKDANLMVLEVPATYPVNLNTVGSASYATLYLPFDVTTDANTKAYVIKEVGDGSAKMTELTGGEIAARTAVVLVNETSNSATFSIASGLSPQVTESENLLKGTLVSRELDLAEGNGNYSLGRLDGQIGFIKYKNGENTTITLGANKAYLEVPASSGNVKGFTLGFGGEDGIGQVVSDESVNGTWYDLNGRRLSGVPAAKGVYIVGGKKVVVK